MVFSQFSTEYNKLHKKNRGDWVFKCYLWYLRFSSFWKRGRAALPDPFQGWSRSHYSIWLHHITSLPGGEKSHIPFSCFSTRFPLTTHSKMPWEHREAWDCVTAQPSRHLHSGLLLLWASPSPWFVTVSVSVSRD